MFALARLGTRFRNRNPNLFLVYLFLPRGSSLFRRIDHPIKKGKNISSSSPILTFSENFNPILDLSRGPDTVSFTALVFLIFLLLETFRFRDALASLFLLSPFLSLPFLCCISKQVSQFFWRRKQERERSAGIRMSLRSKEGRRGRDEGETCV